MQRKLGFLFLLIFTFSASFSQSKIEKSETSLKKQKNNASTSTKRSHNLNNDNDSFGEMLVIETFGRLAINIIAYTAYGILVEMPFERDSPSSSAILTKHPYLNSNKGNYSYEWNDYSAVGRTTISSRYVFENTQLNGNHVNVDIRFYNRLALELDYLQLWENNPNFGYQTLAIYTALIKYHRIRTKQFDGWWGLGASYVDGNVDDFGFSLGLGAELFLGKPISIEANYNQTFINNNAINKFTALMNYYNRPFKLSGGYQSLKIGDQIFSTPTIGLSVSF
ncbi:hypothetical protein E1J38_002855 [Seonamhaeicola sediminis]|uniref:Porin family protein n=1 Tax=Seonamhaeicola sediminis TaxID=2528206 RepID=A0A562YFU0_9FLAO|nr:hypothetical protein [Seonamhaeicola sediminis]TWO33729.1 hypothetical protein E1J38_002855 [Seonamhaeicola sediminis]